MVARDSPGFASSRLGLVLGLEAIGGEEAFELIRKIRDDIPVILTSGYSEQESMRRLGREGLAGFIQKPYELPTLRERLRVALDS